MAKYVLSLGYGRCLEGYKRTTEQINSRRRSLLYAGATPQEVQDDLELICLYADREAWVRLMGETPKFVGVDRV